jgi:glyceraldehyde-3-phosphate dehydrogenase (NADP+)
MVAFSTPKRLLFISAYALTFCLCATASSNDVITHPLVAAKTFINGNVQDTSTEMELAEVYGCCTIPSEEECSNEGKHPIDNRHFSRALIGKMPQFTTEQALQALSSAVHAWNGGSGTWPQMSLSNRIAAVQTFLAELQQKREEIVNVLMWEIGKNRPDAEAEFDRTIEFAKKTIEYIQKSNEFGKKDSSNGSTRLYLSRAAVGIVLCLGPYNYPLNETYAALIPALLMGNVVLLKIPTTGGLAHLLTMEAFEKAFPRGTVNLISGRGRTTMPPLMESGKIDSLAFIGGSGAADDLIRSHPEPHRLKVFLQLEAKNMGVYMPDLFLGGIITDEERVLKETIAGTLSFNGQRCTALKLLFVPKDNAESFAQQVAKKVQTMTVGLPWESVGGKYSQITPLPNKSRIAYMQELIEDAMSKGAKIMNKDGGKIIGGDSSESTLMVPAVMYPITSSMRLFEEEQFV